MTKMTGMTARSRSLSAFSWEASFVKTAGPKMVSKGWTSRFMQSRRLTQTWSEELHVEVRQELLLVGIEMTHHGQDVARKTDADNLHHGLKDQEHEMVERWMRIVRFLHDHKRWCCCWYLVRHVDEFGRSDISDAK